jgi:uncharacterized protein DUF3619
MNEQRVANTIRRYLNLSVSQLDKETAARLQTARATALARYTESKPVLGFAWMGHGGSVIGHGGHHAVTRLSLGLLLLVLVALGITYWQSTDQNSDPGDIDAALLADELPVRAYLDNRFDAWLKHSE